MQGFEGEEEPAVGGGGIDVREDNVKEELTPYVPRSHRLSGILQNIAEKETAIWVPPQAS